MPLNLNDPEDSSLPEKQGTGPVLHEPGEGSSRFPARWILIGVAVVIILAGGWYAWKSGLFTSRGERKPEVNMGSTSQEQAKPPATPANPQTAVTESAPSEPSSQEAKKATAETSLSPKTVGKYTIFISRQRERRLAEEEGARWTAAGYEAYITEADDWFKLSIGRYRTWEEAKAAAIIMQDAFEAGYSVGTIEE